jgi:hypothetical protein
VSDKFADRNPFFNGPLQAEWGRMPSAYLPTKVHIETQDLDLCKLLSDAASDNVAVALLDREFFVISGRTEGISRTVTFTFELVGVRRHPSEASQPEGDPQMTTNNTMAVFLVTDTVRALKATYELDRDNKEAPREWFKTFDKSVKVNDLCVVPSGTRHGFTIVRVTDVDCEVDLQSGSNFRWIAGTFDKTEYEKLLEQETFMLSKIASARKAREREELRKSMLLDDPTLQTLSIGPPKQASE